MRTQIITAAFLFAVPAAGGFAVSAAQAEEVLMLDATPSVDELRHYLAPPRRTRSIEVPSAMGRPAAPSPQAHMASLAGPEPAPAAAAAPPAAAPQAMAPQAMPLQPAPQEQPAAPVTIGFHIQFAYNSSAILAESRPFLDQLAQAMRQEPDLMLVVEGHTDARGSDAYNDKLSLRRAEAVKAYLSGPGQVAPLRLEAVGKGKSEPLTADGYAAENRRVQFRPLQSHPAS